MNKEIEKKIIKYLMNTANIDDLEVLTNWLEDEHHKKIFKNYVRINYAMDINTNEFDTKKAKTAYLRKIKQHKKRKLRIEIFKYAAAAAVVVFAFSYFSQNFDFKISEDPAPIVVKNHSIKVGTDKATLTLEDGSQIALEKGKSIKTQNANSNGEEIIYEVAKQDKKEIRYNYLTIPRGGQFHIVLSDGTEVWLNSESKLKYPVNFIDGQSRIVELVYGEAYFDVSSSTEHDGSDFKVYHKKHEIKVLGTEFNLKAYKDEVNVYTTLAEGKVSVKHEGKSSVLLPGQQSDFNTLNHSLKVNMVDVYRETAWKNGLFSFRNMPLKDIMKVLSRWYDFDFIFENKALMDKKFIGTLDKLQSLEDILSAIKSTDAIESYEISNKILTLK